MKKLLPDLIAILAFVLLSFAYFFPADIENRILFQHDTAAGAGAGQEVKEYYEQTGERSRWTNSLFGGMPMYQIAPYGLLSRENNLNNFYNFKQRFAGTSPLRGPF